MTKWARTAGVALILLGLIGYLTVADDLRHVGELLGTSMVVLTGLLLVGISLRPRR